MKTPRGHRDNSTHTRVVQDKREAAGQRDADEQIADGAEDAKHSFPQYNLVLPFDHTVVGYMSGYPGTFVIVSRDHEHHPFIVYEIGECIPSKPGGPRVCWSGDYCERRSTAMNIMTDRFWLRNGRGRSGRG